jgi:hypothetical protein
MTIIGLKETQLIPFINLEGSDCGLLYVELDTCGVFFKLFLDI